MSKKGPQQTYQWSLFGGNFLNQLPRGLQGPSRGSPGTPQGPSRGCPGYQNGFCYHLIQRCSTQQAGRKLARVLSCIPGGSKPSFKRSGRRETGLTKKLQKKNGESPVLHPRWFQAEFQMLWPQSDRPDQKAPAKKWRESRPVSQVFEGRVSNALAAE